MGANEQGAESTVGRWVVIPRTLCFVTYGNQLLLMKRAAHKRVFPNKYNGLGGHIERDEMPLQGAIREIHEETGLRVKNIRLRGISNIDAGQSSGIMLFIYTAEADTQTVTESDEGTLEWLDIDAVLAMGDALVEDLPILLPKLYGENASQKIFHAHVSYNAQDEIVMVFDEDT